MTEQPESRPESLELRVKGLLARQKKFGENFGEKFGESSGKTSVETPVKPGKLNGIAPDQGGHWDEEP